MQYVTRQKLSSFTFFYDKYWELFSRAFFLVDNNNKM